MIWSWAATTHNPDFRDVGGHLTQDGQRVRSGLFDRSVDLAGLDGEALDWLGGLGLRTVFDLRSDAEIRAAFGLIVDDFMAQGGERSVIELIISARQVYLETALDEVGQRYWTLEGYLRDGLGLERDVLDALRSAFLEAA